VVDERLKFVARILDGEAMSDVCRSFGISRKTGYKIFNRYKESGLEALTDRSRRPVRYANQLPDQIESLIVRLKQEKPHWGARKIRELLVRRLDGDFRIPAKSTIHAVLHRHGLGATMEQMEEEGEHPTGLAAIRTMLLTGFRKMEVLGMHRGWIHAHDHSICFPDTKAGQQVRVIGQTAIDLLVGRPARDNSPFVFPADWGDGHFIGVVRVLDRICARARLEGVTPHVLRHTFASLAAELGFSELTIAGLLGHASRGVTQRYVHFDKALASAADRVAAEIARLVVPTVSTQRNAAE